MSLSKPRRSISQKKADLTLLEDQVKTLFRKSPELTTTQIGQLLKTSKNRIRDLYEVLRHLEENKMIKRQPLAGGTWISLMPVVKSAEAEELRDSRIPHDITYLDWNDMLSQLLHCYKHKFFPLLIGPKGTGKTQAVLKLCELTSTPLETINLSLRAREHHFLGRLNPQPDGTVIFKKGVLARTMEEGTCLYIDEANAGEPDVLLRLDEALDNRRQLSIEDIVIRAVESWFCIASINPLDHVGTKELPPQLISRFSVRLHFTYPDTDNEMQIIRAHEPHIKGDLFNTMRTIVESIQQLRTQDLPYTPSLRETVTMGKLLAQGVSVKNVVTWCVLNVYWQYGSSVVEKVRELLVSRGVKA